MQQEELYEFIHGKEMFSQIFEEFRLHLQSQEEIKDDGLMKLLWENFKCKSDYFSLMMKILKVF